MKGLYSFLALALVATVALMTALVASSDGAGGATTYLPSPWVVTSDTTLRGGTFQANTSIEVASGTLTLEDTELIVGRGSSGYGLMVDAGASMESRRSTIRGNESYWTYVYLYGDTRLDNTTVVRFSSLYQYGGRMVVDHCEFLNNRYTISSQSDLVVRASSFTNAQTRSISWTYSSDGRATSLVVVDSNFYGTGSSGTGISIQGPSGNSIHNTASVTGCLFSNLNSAVSVDGFYYDGSLDLHGNVGMDCYTCLSISTLSEVMRISGNRWNPAQTGAGIRINSVFTYSSTVELADEQITGGGTAVAVEAYGDTVVMRRMNITESRIGLYSYNAHVDIYDSTIKCHVYDFQVSYNGIVHIYNCDHTHKGYQEYSYDNSMIAELSLINVSSVTWQTGLSITTGTTEITNETGYTFAVRDNENPEPIEVPTWMIRYEREVTVDMVRGAYTVRGVRFMSGPVPVASVTDISLVIIDDRLPTAVVWKPRPGDVFKADGFEATGLCDDIGAGVFKLEVRYAEGAWTRAAIETTGIWSAILGGLLDDVAGMRVRTTDYAGNVNDTVVANITVDTRFPTIEMVKCPRIVNRSPVTIVAVTERHARAYVDELEVPVTANGAFQVTVQLMEGENTVRIRAVDPVGNTVTMDVTIVLDSKAPTLHIDSPADGTWLSARSVAVVGLVSESVELTVGDVVRRVDAGMFEVIVQLDDAVNLLVITAQDEAGNYATGSLVVRVDRDRPVLSIFQPTDGSRTREGLVTVTGTVLDDGPVTVSMAGRSASIVRSEWYCELALSEGENRLEVTAVDAAGNVAIASVQVVLDTTPPKATVRLVIDGTKVDPLAGEVRTRSKEVGVEVWLDEECDVVSSPGVPSVLEAGTSTFTLNLLEGLNDVRITLTDTTGNAAAPIEFPIMVDSLAPVLELSDKGPVRTRHASLLITGTSEPGCRVTVGGVVVEVLGDGSFSALVQLEEGNNLIELAAVDAAGNRATRSLLAEMEVVEVEKGAWDARSQGIVVGLVIGIACALAAALIGMRRRGGSEPQSQGRPLPAHAREDPAVAMPDDALRTEGSTVRVVRRDR